MTPLSILQNKPQKCEFILTTITDIKGLIAKKKYERLCETEEFAEEKQSRIEIVC